MLAWHTRERVLGPQLVQQVLRFVGRVNTLQYVDQGGGAISQLDLPSLTPLSVAGCGRLQLGVPYWATTVFYCK